MKTTKKILYVIWIAVVLSIFILFLVSPASFSPQTLADFLSRYGSQLFIAYVFICLVRGLFLIPSTPFVLAGIILFPDQPWAILCISLLSVIMGSTAVYYFSDLLGFSEKLEKKYPQKIERWHKRLNSPMATWIVIAWSFFPLVPTDIICYVAGIVKMPFRYMILGVLIGETILVYLYVFYGVGLLEYFFD